MGRIPLLLALTGMAYGCACSDAIKIIIEAEHCARLVPHMTRVRDVSASGGGYLLAPTLQSPCHHFDRKEDQGRAFYWVKAPSAGVYRFWGRCWWTHCSGNSFYVRVGPGLDRVIGQDAMYGRWHWVKGPLCDLSAGLQQVMLRYREDGARLDQFMLTKNLSYMPVRAMAETLEYLSPPPD